MCELRYKIKTPHAVSFYLLSPVSPPSQPQPVDPVRAEPNKFFEYLIFVHISNSRLHPFPVRPPVLVFRLISSNLGASVYMLMSCGRNDDLQPGPRYKKDQVGRGEWAEVREPRMFCDAAKEVFSENCI